MFTCLECKKEFSKKHNLNRHIISIHRQTRNYKCETCNQDFSRLDVFKNHEKTHIPTLNSQQNESIEHSAGVNDVTETPHEQECEDDCITETSIGNTLMKKTFKLQGAITEDLLTALKEYKEGG